MERPITFWMSAFLARKMGKEVGSPDGGMYAAYLAELGYQMRSDTLMRDPNRVFMVDTFDPANNKLRVDVAFASAGAVYGKRSAANETQKSLNV